MTRGEDVSAWEDEALVRAHQSDPGGPQGRAALAALVQRWRGRVYLWAYRVLREREAALDVAQDALVRMVQALPRYEARGRFSAWLFTIVHNRCLSAVRARTLRRDPEIDMDDLPATTADPERGPDTRAELERVLRAMERSLEPAERTALWLRAYEAMSVEDITRLLGLDSASGARGLLQTARRKLRAALAQDGRRDEEAT
jgi:RNA polymerase sigma-70 factor (ECF subfamily)